MEGSQFSMHGRWEVDCACLVSLAVRAGSLMGLNKLTAEKPYSVPKAGLLKREVCLNSSTSANFLEVNLI